jgi:hypothetical protein
MACNIIIPVILESIPSQFRVKSQTNIRKKKQPSSLQKSVIDRLVKTKKLPAVAVDASLRLAKWVEEDKALDVLRVAEGLRKEGILLKRILRFRRVTSGGGIA